MSTNTTRTPSTGLGMDRRVFFRPGRHGLAERNLRYGISIGHHDTDNLIRDNQITRSGKIGVFFRPGPGKAFAPHRNRLENNRIVDSGPDDGIGVDVRGETESVTIRGNEIRGGFARGQGCGNLAATAG